MSHLRFDPDTPPVAIHDLLADRQPDTRARKLVTLVQASEYLKNLIQELRLDADAVTGRPIAAFPLGGRNRLTGLTARPAPIDSKRASWQNKGFSAIETSF